MKQLILCRHSKPESNSSSGRDHDRKLTQRGKRDARSIGRKLVERQMVPDLVLASDSTRTRETTAMICKAFPGNPAIHFLGELYSGTGGTILDAAASFAADAQTILIVGHNPGMEAAAWQLSGDEIRMHPGTTVVFSLDAGSVSPSAPLEGLRLVEVLDPNT